MSREPIFASRRSPNRDGGIVWDREGRGSSGRCALSAEDTNFFLGPYGLIAPFRLKLAPWLDGAIQWRWWGLRLRARSSAAILAVSVIAGVLAAPVAVQAQEELKVRVGGFFKNGAPGEGVRFYAPELNVHTGDTLTFANRGFHTATFLPSSVTDVAQWQQDNQAGLDKPYSVLLADPDDIDSDPGASDEKPPGKFNNAVAFPDPPDCGAPEQPPCEYSGDSVLNSGALTFTRWSSTITADPGTSAWVLCLIHPNMTLKVNVVDDTAETTTQDEIDSYKESQSAEDAEAALKKHNRLLNKHVKKNGKWQAWSGYDGDGYALIAMYPRKLEIKKGQEVEWNFHLSAELHTVTFPIKKGRKVFARDFLPGCDPDGDAGPGPDNPPDTEQPPFCDDPSQLEFDIAAKTIHLYGDGQFAGSDYENSGVRGAGAPTYSLKFTEKSDSKGYKYMCLIHGPFQRGTVEVK
jgi:plastocyanin